MFRHLRRVEVLRMPHQLLVNRRLYPQLLVQEDAIRITCWGQLIVCRARESVS